MAAAFLPSMPAWCLSNLQDDLKAWGQKWVQGRYAWWHGSGHILNLLSTTLAKNLQKVIYRMLQKWTFFVFSQLIMS